jgi:hypothetical protein
MLGTKIHLLIYNPFQAGYVSLLSSVRQAMPEELQFAKVSIYLECLSTASGKVNGIC